MDVVDAMLDGHRARGAFLLRCSMAAPWSIRIEDRAEVCLLVMVRGHAWVRRGTGAAPRPDVRLGAGDVAVIRSTEPYLLADDPGREAMVVIEPGQVCRPLDPSGPEFTVHPDGWGNHPAGPDAFLTGIYELPGQVTGQLLDGVPDLAVVRAVDHPDTAVRLLAEEFDRDSPGQGVVLDRLVDLILIGALRTWFDRHPDAAPPWWRGRRDEVVGVALRLIHDRLADPWTLASLATAAGVSRATLARRFGLLVGQPPMTYLARLRLATAADLLLGTADGVQAIGRQVGYANPFAFSTAFKRQFGVAPRDYRRAGAA